MKKFLFLILCLFIPMSVKAVGISNVLVDIPNNASMGDEIKMKVTIKPSNLSGTTGIFLAGFSFRLSDDAFTITGISSPNFDTEIYKDGNTYYAIGTVSDNISNSCVDILYCSDYVATVNLYVSAKTKGDRAISVTGASLGFLNITDSNKEYTIDDIEEVEYNKVYTQNVIIREGIMLIEDVPTAIKTPPKSEVKTDIKVTPKKTTTTSKPTTTKKPTNTKKSTNNYLKNLEVENYEIAFDKEKKKYTIKLDKNINKIIVKPTLEDSKATYTIKGVDDLKSNSDKVEITVKAENDDKRIYTIYIERPKEEKRNINFNILLPIGIGIGVVFIIFLLIKFIIYLKEGKEERKLNKL